MGCKEGGEKEKGEEAENWKSYLNLQSQSDKHTGSYVTLNRSGLYFNHNESCLERVCCLLVASQVLVECKLKQGIMHSNLSPRLEEI